MFRLTNDFHVNKRIIDDVASIQTKRLRNKIAGFTTHLMKRIEKGPVRGISLRLQEEVSRSSARIGRSCTVLSARNSNFFLIIIGERKKDGLHPREIRDPDLQHRGQKRPRPQGLDQISQSQAPHPKHEPEEQKTERLSGRRYSRHKLLYTLIKHVLRRASLRSPPQT